MTSLLRWSSVLLLAAVVTGCTVAPGTPTTPDTPASATATSAGLPARPKEIKLDGLTPQQVCALVSEQQAKQLGIDTVRETNDIGQFKNKGCWLAKATARDGYAYYITPTTQQGAEVWLKPGNTVKARVVSAAGYPAVENRRPTDDRGCFVDVSVADGQRLGIQYSYDSQPVPYTPEQLCAKALEMAELATQGLIKLRG
ncbi:DUF3558 domain-containing protein [Crossiella sp. SN42]|uniref:DUF3558 domain-containing protein n=1 Tax=Crossiella sp. SN42 TaxID=2944808 RepID=UPI00207CA7CC|nr:DUF3558 domain-containing protein [Crossiella sp. SN42]MCO1575859.1 DUF3558 domain-containing protein [Crossiella sp. SN42]